MYPFNPTNSGKGSGYDHSTESYGTGDKSVKRCLALMRDECPMGENNFYVEAE